MSVLIPYYLYKPLANIRKMTNIKHKITIITFLFLFLTSFGQQNELGYKTERLKLYSQNKNEYILKITFPRNYNPKKEYKTLYYLDTYWLTDIIIGSYTILEFSDYVESVVFVGISYNSESNWNKQRNMDFTPSSFKNLGFLEKEKITVKASGKYEINKNNTGGANLFLDFLENNIIKFIETKYPNLNKRKGLLGHSFGGLFGFYTLQNRPELFQDLLLISASLTWNSSELVEEDKFSKLKESKSEIKFYHSYGSNEVIRTANDNINKIMTELELQNFNYKFAPVVNTNHQSVLPRAIYDG